MKPTIAVVGIPDLPSALRQAGYDLVVTATDPASVAAAVRDVAEGRPIIVLSATPAEQRTASWLGLQASRRGCFVAVLGADPNIPHVRCVPLPASVNEVMATFRAPAVEAAAGAAVVRPDYTVGGLEPEPSEDLLDWGAPEPPAPPAPDPGPAPAAFEAYSPAPPPPEPAPAAPVPQPFDHFEAGPAPEPATARRPAPQPFHDTPAPAVFGHFAPDPPTARSWEDPDFERIGPAAPVAQTAGDMLGGLDPDRLVASRTRGGDAITRSHGLAPVIVVCAAKGGVGKSTFATSLAQRAVEKGGLQRVILVDGNRGQGDLRKYLRLGRSPLPTMYDAALTGRPETAINGPKYLCEYRDARLPALGFGLVMAPREGQSDPSVVTDQTYGTVVERARRFAELVVVDTQILEDSDTSGLWDRVWLPLLRSGAWGLGLADGTSVAVTNLLSRLQGWSRAGLSSDRMMLALNNIGAASTLRTDEARRLMSNHGTFAGLVHHDERISAGLETGRLPQGVDELDDVLDEVLFRMTGLDVFRPDPHRGDGRSGGGMSLLGRLFGRGGGR